MMACMHYLEASISTRLAGSPSRHRLQSATWLALLSAGREPSAADAVAIGLDRGGLKSEDMGAVARD